MEISLLERKNQWKEKKRWAVVGATEDADKFGYKIVSILKQKGYTVYPVNPKYDTVCGLTCYHTLQEIQGDVDVVNMVVNRKLVPEVLRTAKTMGIQSIWFQPNTYDEEIVSLAKELNLDYLVGFCIYAELR